MKLYFNAASPYVRKVMMVLHETSQLSDVEIIAAHGTPVAPGSMPIAQNPLGKLPTLECQNGQMIYDSRVICRYLNDRAGGNLYPDGNRLWDTLTLEATADGILDAALLMVYEGRVRPKEIQYPDWVDAQWAKATRAIAALNTRWISHLAGPLDMGQIAVACALGYCDFRLADRNWRAENDALANWFEQFSGRDSFRATIPSG